MSDILPAHKRKAVIWVDSFETSGPVAVTDRTVQALEDQGFEVVIVGPDHTFKGVPHFVMTAKKTSIGRCAQPDDLEALRLRNAIIQEKPDVLITEEYPLVYERYRYGKMLDNAIRTARAQNPQLKVYSLARDVPVYERLTGSNAMAAAERVHTLYDRVLVMGDKKLYGAEYYDALGLHKQLSYVGYPIPKFPEAANKNHHGHVMVQLGGGDDNNALYLRLLELIPRLSPELQNKEWHFVCHSRAAGLMQDMQSAWKQLPEALQRKVKITGEDPYYLDELSQSSLAIVRGGHSAIEAVGYNRPTVIIPNAVPEQIGRADALAREFKHRAFVARAPMRPCETHAEPDGASDIPDSELIATIEKAYAAHKVKSEPRIKLDGHERVAKSIVADLQGDKAAFKEGRVREA